MRVLVINTGSSSVKSSVFDMATGERCFKDEIERVSRIEDALEKLPGLLEKAGQANIDAVGHRVAHGGEKFRDAVIIDAMVKKAIEDCVPLAPQHNPPALAGIALAKKAWPGVKQVAVFDTAFHQSIPERATTYAVPESWRQAGLRRYGFHGTSHRYVMERAAEELKQPATSLRIISCHLGNGASVCAIDHGRSIDTSMGMTALEGLVMGSRSGDVDPGIFSYLGRKLKLSVDAIEKALYEDSGLKGLSGIGNDMRDIEKRAAEGDKKAMLAIQVYAYRVAKYIGAYAAAMNGFNVLAFTGGIGENSASMRKRICEQLGFLGLTLDEEKNTTVKLTGFEAPQIQQENSLIRVVVTQTREQWMIAKETSRVLSAQVKRIPSVPVAVSAHHVHLTLEAVEQLFGKGYQLRKLRDLKQTGEWASEETVDVVGPKGAIKRVRVLGPCRKANQVEVAETETFQLGLNAPIRISGNTKDTPVVTLVGPAGSIQTEGLIIAQRHIHMSPQEAEAFGLKNGDLAEVEVGASPRSVVFGDVAIRIDPRYRMEMHIDTDEANAANIAFGGEGELYPTESEGIVRSLHAMTHHKNNKAV